MLKSIVQLFSLRHRYVQVPLAGLLLMVNISAAEVKPSWSKEQPTSKLLSALAAARVDQSSAPTAKLPEADGVYVYGQSPQPQQLGQEYIVFEVSQGKVIGALYLPQSEFSCFNGTQQAGELAMMVASSADSEPYPDSTAEENSRQVATASSTPPIMGGEGAIAYPYTIALQNYHQLSSVSDNDQRILAACKANYQQ